MVPLLGINWYILSAKSVFSKSEWTDWFIKQTWINIMHVWMDASVCITMHICMRAQLTSHRILSCPLAKNWITTLEGRTVPVFSGRFLYILLNQYWGFTVVTGKGQTWRTILDRLIWRARDLVQDSFSSCCGRICLQPATSPSTEVPQG